MRGSNIKSLKKRNRNFVISLIICMVALIIFAYVVFNFRNIFGVGIFNVEDDYINSYSDGTAGVNLHIRLDHDEDNKYYLYTFIEPISTGNVANHGLLSMTIFYLNNNYHVYATTLEFGTPLSRYTDRLFLRALKYNNVTCYGNIELSLEIGGIPINDTINFQLSYIVPMGSEDYYNIDLVLFSLFFLPFFLSVIIPIALNWIFKPVFGLNLSEEDTKRDEKFVHFLQNQVRIKKEESKIAAAKKKNNIT